MDEAALSRDLRLIERLVRLGPGECALTEFLAAVLRVQEVQRTFLSEVVGVVDRDADPAVERVVSEPEDATEFGVPDIEVRGHELFVLVENKLGAAFTKHQPHRYYESLQKWRREHPAGRAALVLVFPERRRNSIESETAQSLAGLRAEGDGVLCAFVAWERLCGVLEALSIEDDVVAYLLRSFTELVRRYVAYSSLPITSEMLAMLDNRQVAASVVAVEKLLRDVRKAIADWVPVRDESDKRDYTYTGFTAKAEGRWVFVGICYQLKEDLNIGPLFAQVSDEERARTHANIVLSGREAERRYDWDAAPVVAIEVVAGLDPAEQVWRIRDLVLGILGVSTDDAPEE